MMVLMMIMTILIMIMMAPLHAWAGLETARTRLLGPLGLATLDKEDWAYRGDYDNWDRGGDPFFQRLQVSSPLQVGK